MPSNEQRFYLACVCDDETGKEKDLIGIFSNQKNFLDAVLQETTISLEDAYIPGQRKNMKVDSGSISGQLRNSINCTIWKEGKPFIKILTMYMNKVNPKLEKKEELVEKSECRVKEP